MSAPAACKRHAMTAFALLLLLSGRQHLSSTPAGLQKILPKLVIVALWCSGRSNANGFVVIVMAKCQQRSLR